MMMQDAPQTSDAGGGPVSHSDYNVVNSDGSPVTQSQLDNLDRALDYLSQSPTALGSLNSYQNNTIELRTDDNDYTSADGKIVGWDPNSALLTNSGGVQSPALGLIHEIGGHAVEPDGLSSAPSPDDAHYDNMAEYTATNYEDRVASELGEPQRADYHDVDRTMLVADNTGHGDYETGAAAGQWDIPGATSFFDFDSLNEGYGGGMDSGFGGSSYYGGGYDGGYAGYGGYGGYSDYGSFGGDFGGGSSGGYGDYENGGFFANETLSYY